MARDFDGTNDNLVTADNAVSGLDADLTSWAWRMSVPALGAGTGTRQVFISGTADAGSRCIDWVNGPPFAAGDFRSDFRQVFSGPDMVHRLTTELTAGQYHIAVTYDRSDPANVPTIYVNGTAVATSQVGSAPSGTPTTGGDTLKIGENLGGTEDLTGTIGWFCAQGGVLWDAAQVNRARWWGRPGGGVTVYYPLVTAKLADEGSSGAALTATGTTVAGLVNPVVRPGSAMMGMGIGW